ncbi:MAG: hypothetical protein QUS09_04185, partial [Methanotrichaceae archaeon]|nr:hypothetical protein [Methanotrichaceae archaeon]
MILAEFKRWYADILEKMYPDRDAGFAIMLITIPILERYIRCKFNLPRGGNIREKGKKAIYQVFPELGSLEAIGNLWDALRNGLLHQLTFFSETLANDQLPIVRLTHDTSVAIRCEDDKSISVHPVFFAERAIQLVMEDFATFNRDDVDSITPLPAVFSLNPG